ncbi:MAG TPA: hypothetical protein VFJ19_08850 [Nocardioidaceae bacterium]|nr:hypothetical protein [Nocardioidaceae bacterium]
MATRAEVEEQRQQQGDIRTLAVAALVSLWGGAAAADPLAVEAELVQRLPEIVAQYGAMSAAVAADFYDSLRHGVPGRFVASPSDLNLAEQVAASARWASSPLFPRDVTTDDGRKAHVPADADKALDRASAVLQRNVLQYGRQTIADNARRDPADARWARVPTGDETCAWCRILASRGAVYESEQSAQFIGESKDKYHDWCDCQPIAVWRDSELPEGYDPDKYMQQYEDAKAQSRSGDIRSIAAHMREQLGVK